MKWFSVFSLLMVFFLFCSNGNSFLSSHFGKGSSFYFLSVGW